MAEGEKALTGTVKPESPTTARPLDFDDDPQETGVVPAPGAPNDEVAPPKPPRPLSPAQEAENTLKEAFPNIDAAVVRAVVVASGGNVDRAFHALLGMSDPSAQVDLPPVKPPRPSETEASTIQQQLRQDEMYARQLAEHYNAGQPRRRAPDSEWEHEPHPSRRSRDGGVYGDEDERERNFIDDDLPVIKENIRKGFLETQTRVNAWMQNFKKKLDGEESEDELERQQHARPGQPYAQGFGESQNYRPRRSAEARRSADRERYDADPQVLSDDFASLELRDNEAPARRPARPAANPDLFKKNSSSPDRRKVSFQEGPPEEIGDPYSSRGSSKNRAASGAGKQSKWQPLTSVEPSPVTDNDPFSLGDSDDEKEAKTKDKDMKADEAERLKKATAEAMAGDISPDATSNKPDKSDKPAGGS